MSWENNQYWMSISLCLLLPEDVLSTVKEFEDIVVRANPDGSIVRIRDVARVSLEASSYSTESGLNGKNAAILAIYMLPGANALEVATNVKEAMKEISQNFSRRVGI